MVCTVFSHPPLGIRLNVVLLNFDVDGTNVKTAFVKMIERYTSMPSFFQTDVDGSAHLSVFCLTELLAERIQNQGRSNLLERKEKER